MIPFDHNGQNIYSPFLSECGRFSVDPAQYGFVLAETGGGCKALIKTLPKGDQIWITDSSGCAVPESAEDAMMGYFRAGEQLAFWDCPSNSEITALNNQKYLAVWGDNFTKPGYQKVDVSFFSDDRGYTIQDICKIAALRPGIAWTSIHYEDHSVVAMPETELSL